MSTVRWHVRFTQLDFRVNLVMQLVNGYSYIKSKTQTSLIVYPLVNSDPSSHSFKRLSRKRSTCKYCTNHGEKRRKETFSGCTKCDKHFCSLDCHKQFHTNNGVFEEWNNNIFFITPFFINANIWFICPWVWMLSLIIVIGVCCSMIFGQGVAKILI